MTTVDFSRGFTRSRSTCFCIAHAFLCVQGLRGWNGTSPVPIDQGAATLAQELRASLPLHLVKEEGALIIAAIWSEEPI